MPFAQFRIVQISGWKIALAAVLLVTLLIALFILAAGIFLLVLPVVAVAGELAYLIVGRNRTPGFSDGVIETEYRVIEQKQLEQDKK